MPRLTVPARHDVPADSKPILDTVEKQLGVVPNMFRLIASSPAALQGYTANNAALARRWTSRPASASRSPSPR